MVWTNWNVVLHQIYQLNYHLMQFLFCFNTSSAAEITKRIKHWFCTSNTFYLISTAVIVYVINCCRVLARALAALSWQILLPGIQRLGRTGLLPLGHVVGNWWFANIGESIYSMRWRRDSCLTNFGEWQMSNIVRAGLLIRARSKSRAVWSASFLMLLSAPMLKKQLDEFNIVWNLVCNMVHYKSHTFVKNCSIIWALKSEINSRLNYLL